MINHGRPFFAMVWEAERDERLSTTPVKKNCWIAHDNDTLMIGRSGLTPTLSHLDSNSRNQNHIRKSQVAPLHHVSRKCIGTPTPTNWLANTIFLRLQPACNKRPGRLKLFLRLLSMHGAGRSSLNVGQTESFTSELCLLSVVLLKPLHKSLVFKPLGEKT